MSLFNRTRSLLAAAIVGTVTLSSPPASATPDLASARRQATALRTQLTALQQRAEIATEQYDAAQEQLGQAVTDYLGAEAVLADARATTATGQVNVAQQVVSLYEAGGPLPVAAQVLQGDDLAEGLDRWQLASATFDVGRRSATSAATQTARLAHLDANLGALAGRRVRMQAQAERSAARVQSLVATQQRLLAAADIQVRTIAAQLEKQAQAAAAAQFRARLAAARDPASLTAAAPAAGSLGATGAPGQTGTGTEVAQAAIRAAQTRLGLPYLWGATGPNSFDCSGLTQWAYRQAGLSLPRTSREQWFAGTHVALANLLPGDLLFWATNAADPGTIHHEAMYLGAGMMLAAPHTGAFVRVEPVYLNGYVGATRPT